ncbi:MAG: hypothetical protein NTW38_05855 [Candidatus Aminicenantes bacterium]|nr:hypothetical protein [Candidatus Aminicenantes bacterium]
MNTSRKRFFPVVLAVLLASVAVPAPAQDGKAGSGVTVSWEEFRKLLALDKDEINLSWEEFQQILRQTGFKYVPAFQLKEERVLLTRAQFRELLNQMKPPADPTLPPPADYLLTQAVYTGKIAAGSVQIHASMSLEVFERPARQYTKVPLFPLPVALKEALVDGARALMILENGRHTLAVSQTGKHRVEIDFSLKMPADQSPIVVAFPIPQTAVTRFEIDLPGSGLAVDVDGAQQLEIIPRGNLTRVEAFLTPTENIRLSWRKKPSEAKRGPAKIYADTVNLLTVEDDALRVGADITLSILQNTVSSVTVGVPAGWRVLDVKGSGIEDWRETTIRGAAYLDIRFESPREGRFFFSLSAEKPLAGPAGTVDFSGFPVVEAAREKGFIGIQLKSASEVTPAGNEGLDRIDVSELPAELIDRSPKPLLLGYKYLRHPFALNLEVQKHEELPVISTVADSASGVTLFTEDGKIVHRVIYSIRNTSKQFLELALPKSAQVWSVFVGGEPVKPRSNGSRILIPLNRSVRGADGLAAFDVEVIYFEKAKSFTGLGRGGSSFPVPDIIISQMLWSVYLPDEYKIVGFGGTVEKEKTASGLRLILNGKGETRSALAPAPEAPGVDKDQKEDIRRREAGRLKSQFSAGLALSEAQIAQQMENEEGFSRRIGDVQNAPNLSGGGLLSIRILIPASGQLFRFAKSLVNEEPMNLDFRYISDGTFVLLKIVALLVLLAVLVLFRRKLRRAFRGLGAKISGLKPKENRIQGTNPPDSPVS